ncbi:hypothetical protein D3C79_670220 [compost metagenome]
MDGDQGHHRTAGGNIVAHVSAQVSDQPIGIGAHHGAGQVQAGLFHIGRRTAQLRVVRLHPALLLPRPFDFRTGCRHLADGLVAGRLRPFKATDRHCTWVFFDQPFEPLGILAGLALVGLGRHQGGLGRVDAGGIGADLPAYRIQICLSAGQGNAVLLLIQLEQHITLAHLLVVAHRHALDLPGNFSGHGHHIGLQTSLLGVRREPVGKQVPDQAHDDQHQHPVHGAVRGRVHGVTHQGSPCSGSAGAGSSSRSPQSVRFSICWRVAGSTGLRWLSQPPPSALYSVTRLLTAFPRLTR